VSTTPPIRTYPACPAQRLSSVLTHNHPLQTALRMCDNAEGGTFMYGRVVDCVWDNRMQMKIPKRAVTVDSMSWGNRLSTLPVCHIHVHMCLYIFIFIQVCIHKSSYTYNIYIFMNINACVYTYL